jgi:hypothetical protein
VPQPATLPHAPLQTSHTERLYYEGQNFKISLNIIIKIAKSYLINAKLRLTFAPQGLAFGSIFEIPVHVTVF